MLALLPALTLFAFVSSITPGPNNLMLMTSGLNFGFRRTLPHMLGISVGFSLMVLLVGLGLAELFTRLPVLLVALKWIGAAYLLWLAVKIARSGPIKPGAKTQQPFSFLQAAAFQWVNPKAWIMGVTACATYGQPGAYTASVTVIALILGVVGMPCIAMWAGFGTALRGILSHPRSLHVFNWSMAALLVASLYPIFTE